MPSPAPSDHRRPPLTLLLGLSLIALWVVCALAAPWIAPYSPTAVDFGALSQPPSWQHWFGTDRFGRDILSRVIYGAAQVLMVAPAATLLGLLLGTLIGLITAYYGRWIDEAIMRMLDAVMALPLIVLAMLALTLLGPSKLNVVLVIGLVFAPLVARTVRARAMIEVRREYLLAARMRGEGTAYQLLREILPNVGGPLVVEGTIRLGYAVFTSATLGFLGLGAQPPSPDWGLMVSQNQTQLTSAPWTVLFPVLAIVLVVIGIGLTADGLRTRLDA
ncbi:ABC transporter permease [Acidihalobacter prosperus]|nr:ABC transporter permease [Acidihalobacter prosperus]